MRIAEITKDVLYEKWNSQDDEDNLVGTHWEVDSASEYVEWSDVEVDKLEKVPFKLYDDDGELYYQGWLLNDDFGIVQFLVLRWAESDSGCTTIKVKVNNEWKQEIG